MEEEDSLSPRASQLGFKPQKETVYNQALPYSDKLDHESQRMLMDIKGGLGKSVLLKEKKPGLISWCNRLCRYIQMFGYKFSKADHIAIIKLLYEILTKSSIEPYLVYRLSLSLSCLLRKKSLISREELTLPWRPLYNVCDKLLGSSSTSFGMLKFSPNVDNALADLIAVARVYFEPTATQEMLDMWRPLLCPLDSVSIQSTFEMLDSFLPSIFLPQERALGYELWFKEFMDLWKTCHNSPIWEPSLLNLFSRVASHNVGLIDWEPYFPIMYSHILRSFSLPVNYKKIRVNKQQKLNTCSITLWIVSTLGGGSSSQTYLNKLMNVLESYFHPANVGAWLARLRDFLGKLPFYFIRRLNMERQHKPVSWQTPVPIDKQLTEDDITRFVQSLAPTATLAVYSRAATQFSMSLQNLATLRPNLVIPPIVDNMYIMLESLTEPHKYTAALLSLVSVARPMVEANEYTAGPTHVIPLLTAILPGIDPNDIRKCFITFQAITTFISMIPVVDCSNASEFWNDLTEEEAAVCAASSQMEDFVIEFVDRSLLLVEHSILESTRLEQHDHSKQRRSNVETALESVIVSAFSCLLAQTSPDIFKSALRKLHSFTSSRILETTVSGKCLASICRTFAKARPEETLKLLVPHFCQMVLSHAYNEDIHLEEKLDNEMLYNLLLLSEVVCCFGDALLSYGSQLEEVLDLTLHLKCKEGYTIAARMLSNMLQALATTRPREFKSTNHNYGKPVNEFLPIREWSKPHSIKDVKVEWYVPGQAEVNYAQHLVTKYLIPELQTIQSHTDGVLDLTREQLQCSLSVVSAVLCCASLLPVWEEPIIQDSDSLLEFKHFFVECTCPGAVKMPDGSNVRKAIAKVIARLQDKLFSSAEDDTKNLNCIVNIWGAILMNYKPSNEEVEGQYKAINFGKQVFENKLLGKRRHIRSILVNNINHRHELILCRSDFRPSETDLQIIQRMFDLSVSHYSEVRRNAQGKLNTLLYRFGLYRHLLPKILQILQKDSNTHHDEFKGVLYLLLGPKQNPLVVRPVVKEWSVIRQLWPALVNAQPSEKPSVINLLNAISDTVHKNFCTITIKNEIENEGEEFAKQLWTCSCPLPSLALPTEEEVSAAREQVLKVNASNEADYLHLLDSLIHSINSNLHWRHHHLAIGFLRDLAHPDCNYPAPVIRNFLLTLIHDNIEFRKVSIRCLVYVLKQLKRKHKKQKKAVEMSCNEYGDRDDNQWLQYNSKTAPLTQAAWDEPRYSHEGYTGYFSWDKNFEIYSPYCEQPQLERTKEDMSLEEREIYDFFSDSSKVALFISYLSLEEKKGKDKFNGVKYIFFKNLFRNYGDAHIELFYPHLERLINDKQESHQRCAAEIICGLIRGAKHWPFDKVQKMWNKLIPLLRTAFSNMTVETVHDWSVMAATASENRDPNRQHWFLEFLMEDPLRQGASFIDCGRLCALQGALNQHAWRVVELYNRLLGYLNPHLSHPYQLLRERIGSVLTNMLGADLPTAGPNRRTRGPLISDFVKTIMPKLASLYSLLEPTSGSIDGNEEMNEDQNPSSSIVPTNENGTNNTLCLMKTMVKWVTNSLLRADYGLVPEFLAFLPLACLLQNYEADDELNDTCSMMLAAMAQALTLPEFVPTALAAIDEVSKMSYWSARVTCLEFLQVFVFHNMAIITSEEFWISQVNSLVLRLLRDERVEVREAAGQVLSGLIHCGFISDRLQLLNDLKCLASKKKTSCNDELAKRHAGVLGLCAFISANPYDVVEPVPEVFLLLGHHLNDPQPIPGSIRKTLSDFKRTHHYNWDQHKLKFSEEQIAVLTDMVVPPSYYA